MNNLMNNNMNTLNEEALKDVNGGTKTAIGTTAIGYTSVSNKDIATDTSVSVGAKSGHICGKRVIDVM